MSSSFNERIHPENSFTMACRLQLHNSITNRHEPIRKNLPFLLLPDKRTLLDVSKKSASPLDFFFSNDSASPDCNVLKKVTKIVSNLNKYIILKEERNILKLIVALTLMKSVSRKETYLEINLYFDHRRMI